MQMVASTYGCGFILSDCFQTTNKKYIRIMQAWKHSK